MFPDDSNLCFVWFCEYPGSAPIKRPCAKGVRVPSWWEGGRLQMCTIVNILKHGGEPTCLRCAADDQRPQDSKLSSNMAVNFHATATPFILYPQPLPSIIL